MHGMPRPKPGGTQDPSKLKKKQEKAALYGRLSGEVLMRRAAKRYDEESMQLSARLLELNPEVYTVWNYRREYLGPVLSHQVSDEARTALAAELALTQKALAVNPKSYATWHHRRWVVVTGGSDLQFELALVHKLLSLDSRNFHGWAYWRWLAARMQHSSTASLEYTEHHLRENFSNYSAWHARTLLLVAAAQPPQVATLAELLAQDVKSAPQSAQRENANPEPDSSEGTNTSPRSPSANTALPSAAAIPATVLGKEFEMTHRALWTEPKDQSAWLYHWWLLGCCLAAAGLSSAVEGSAAEGAAQAGSNSEADSSAASSALLSRLEAEATMCEDLLQEEPDAKWPLLTLARVQESLVALRHQYVTSAAASATSMGSNDHAPQERRDFEAKLAEAADRLKLGKTAPAAKCEAAIDQDAPAVSSEAQAYTRLAAVDPLRRGYYESAAAGHARVVLRTTALS